MVEPTKIIEESEREIRIIWSDGAETKYTAPMLRKKCPCASCVNEWTGEKILNEASVSDDLVINSTSVVGRYALNFHFSDGHDTGIFSFRYLRNISK
jgi:DUF971 family protein